MHTDTNILPRHPSEPSEVCPICQAGLHPEELDRHVNACLDNQREAEEVETVCNCPVRWILPFPVFFFFLVFGWSGCYICCVELPI